MTAEALLHCLCVCVWVGVYHYLAPREHYPGSDRLLLADQFSLILQSGNPIYKMIRSATLKGGPISNQWG